MNRQVRIYMNNAEQAEAFAKNVNSQSNQSGLHADVRGAELTITPANPLVEDIVAGLGYLFSRIASLFQERSESIDGNVAHR